MRAASLLLHRASFPARGGCIADLRRGRSAAWSARLDLDFLLRAPGLPPSTLVAGEALRYVHARRWSAQAEHMTLPHGKGLQKVSTTAGDQLALVQQIRRREDLSNP